MSVNAACAQQIGRARGRRQHAGGHWTSGRRALLGVLLGAACAGAAACGGAPDAELVERFSLACERLAAEATAAGTEVITGDDGWYFAPAEVAALGGGTLTAPGPVRAIAAAADRLRGAGIDLLVVPVPPKAVIYPDRLAPELGVPIPVPRLDGGLQAIYDDLRARGVRLIDLTRPFIRDRFHHEGPLYCRQDSRWSGVGCVLAAESIAAAARDAGGGNVEPLTSYGLAWFTTPVRGDLWRRLSAPPAPEEIRVRGVIAPDDARLEAVTRQGGSPVAVVGDAHTLVFHAGDPHHARGAGLADQLAFEFRRPIALHAEDAAAPSAVEWRVPAFADETRIVVWVFAATRLLR